VAGSVRTWTLKIRGDEHDAIRAADKVENRYDRMGGGINRKLSNSLDRSESRFGRFRTRVSRQGAAIGAVFGGAVVAGIAGLGVGIVSTFKAAAESIKIGRDTSQVIKTMGGVANISAKQVGDLASRISMKTGVDDEAIQSGQNLLLTFGNIRNEVGKGNDMFNQASQVTVDFAARFKKDIPGAAVIVGKALNDPIKGLTSLGRVGVQFTEDQKAQIRTMVESGDVMGAQRIIMAELKRETGGAAEAMATPWDRLKVTLGNVQEQIGIALMPVINRLVTAISEDIPRAIDTVKSIWQGFIGGFRGGEVTSSGIVGVAQRIGIAAREAWPHIQQVGRVIAQVAGHVRDFFSQNPAVAFTVLGTVLGGVVLAAVIGLATAVGALISPFVLVIAVVAAVAGAVVYAWTRWEGFRNVVMGVVQWFQSSALPAIRSFIDFVIGKFNQLAAWPGWQKIVTIVKFALTVVAAVIVGFVVVALALWDRFGSTILTYVRSAFNAIWNIIQGVLQVVAGIINFWLAIFTGDWGAAWDAIKQIVSGVWQVIQGLISLALAQIRYVIGLAWQAIQAVTGIVWNAILAVLRTVWAAIWGAITAVVGAIVGFFREHWRVVLAIFTGGLSALILFVVGKWDTIKTSVSEAIGWVKRKIESVLGTISRLWSRIWGGMGDALGAIWDGIKGAVTRGINAVIGVINWFIRLINKIPGIPDIPEISRVGGGSRGAGASAGGGGGGAAAARRAAARNRAMGGFLTNQGGRGAEYVAGEGNRFHPEAVIATDPRYRKRNRALVSWAAGKLGMGAPGYQLGGIVDAVTAPIRGVSNVVSGFVEDIRGATLRPVFGVAKRMVDALPIPAAMWGKEIKGFGKEVLDRMYRFAAGKADEHASEARATGGPGGNAGYRGGGVERWRGVALRALRAAGAPASWIGSLLRRMNQESGGNPNIQNNWDSNARAGTPSIGLMQTIGPTFRAYAGRFVGRGIRDPFANIYASIKYAIARYGSGPAGWDRPGGYRNGGIVNVPGPTHPGELVLRRGDQRQLLKLVRGRSPNAGGGPSTEVHIDNLVVNANTPAEGRAAGHAFMDVIERRQIEHDARSA
jgi:phage-related protein